MTLTNPANLKPVQQRLLAKLIANGMAYAPENGLQNRTNPFSGATRTLEPLAAGLYDWIVSPRRGDDIAAGRLNRGLWDRARYLFLALWPDDYYTLID